MNEDDNVININDLDLKPHSIAFIRTKIKEAEQEMDYLGRCFSDLDDKPTLTDDQKKEFRRVLKKLQKINQELSDLWTDEEIAVDMERAHSEGRSYFPFEDERVGKQLQANILWHRLNALVEKLHSVKSAASAETSQRETIEHLQSETHRLEGILGRLEEEGIKPNPDSPH
jgi:DNA-binding MarR family transcriptional regulator